MFRGLKRFAKFTMEQTLKLLGLMWGYFAKRTLDVQIAIVVSIYTLATFAFGTLHWFTVICFLFAWGVVHRKYTWPVIVGIWNATETPRHALGVFLSNVLLTMKYGIPVAMIGWGVMSFIGFGLSFYISKEWAAMFGMAGFTGIIFGTFFYAVQMHSRGKTKSRR